MSKATPTFGALDLRRALVRYRELLAIYREALNRLNVYPVPDGDTGTNMHLTMVSVVEATGDVASLGGVAEGMAHGSLMGAQGNSGIILAQILRGLAAAIADHDAVGPAHMANGLEEATKSAYLAVGRPVEGTILTVLRESAAAAIDQVDESLASQLESVFGRAQEALESTPELLPVLADAGVVDAGGAGYLLLLAALLEGATGGEVALPEDVFAAVPRLDTDAVGATEGGVGDLRYEVMFMLASSDEEAGAQLREQWSAVGDSIVVVGGAGVWNCHVHTDDIGTAVELGIELGTPSRIKVTDLLDQAGEVALHGFTPLPEFAQAEPGVLAVAAGPGLIRLFRDAGAQAVVEGGQTMNPSVGDLLNAVQGMAASTVIVLPNNKNVIAAARQIDDLTDKQVYVVPTVAATGGLAAMLAYLPGSDAPATVAEMAAAADECVDVAVTRAVREATTPIGKVAEGDWLGIVEGAVAVAAADLSDLMQSVLEMALPDGIEIVTVITGDGATPDTTSSIERWVAVHRPGAAVDVVDGGQPLYPYLIGAE